ncbi:RHS domain-containing protein, partial [Salmonella enterica subsp. enterica serovar Kentucky]|nr:RHS domain-containing protein [Salmonella enterica subsp. enterica serovar Kentucky]
RMYDRTGRLTRKLTCKGMRGVVPETFIDREYAYSGQDELLKKRHSRQGVTDYFYDTTGRITACRNEAYLDSWQYDAAANLLDRRQGETAQAGAGSVVPFNRITSYRGLHYRYDEYGRVVEKRGRNGTQHYRWDAEHRLTEVAVTRGSTVRRYGYVYDAPGRRVEKHELDAEGKPYNRTTFLWDGMRLAQECRLGRSSSLYIYSDQGSHEPLARVDRAAPGEADEVLYYHTDVNGAPEEMTDGGGNIVWEAGYQVWGNLTHEKETRPVQQNLRFQGQYLDRETGLHYNLYRFYDPDIGKFISGDPISLKGGINLYAYAPNPLSWIDPLGLKCGSSYEQARNKALKWLEERGFKAERVNIGKFGSTRGKPVGMTTADGKTGFRIEYDERSGAHINVFSGKDKGEHFLFDASESIVTKLQKLFDLPSKPQRPIS